MNVTINDAKGERSIVNIQDYDIYNLELKNERTILPFQIDTRNNMVAYNMPYMPLPIENGTPVIGNYGLSVPGPQTVVKKIGPRISSQNSCRSSSIMRN